MIVSSSQLNLDWGKWLNFPAMKWNGAEISVSWKYPSREEKSILIMNYLDMTRDIYAKLDNWSSLIKNNLLLSSCKIQENPY